MNGLDKQLIAVIRHIVEMLVARDYSAIANVTRGVRLSPQMLKEAVSEYGRALVMPPDSAFLDIDSVSVTNALVPTWSVNFALWTIEEGRSDLTLELTLIERHQDQIDAEIDNLHVL